MKQLTEEQFKYLRGFEDRFVTATKSNYCRNVQKQDVIKIKEIYEYLIEQEYRMSVACATCILNLIKRIAPIYFEYQEKLKTNESEGSRAAEENREAKKGRGKRESNRRTKN
nr:MAG: hypothetical protein [Bacteriophage sp.]